MEVNLIAESFKFLILGMATVFLFLILMIYVLKLQSYIIQKYFTSSKETSHKSTDSSANVLPVSGEIPDEDGALIAAITAAIADYRKTH